MAWRGAPSHAKLSTLDCAPSRSACAALHVVTHARPASDGTVSGRRSTRRRRRPPLRKVRAPATFDAALRFLADHPDPAAVVECTLPDGAQGWVPASVAALVEAMPPENAARCAGCSVNCCRRYGRRGCGAALMARSARSIRSHGRRRLTWLPGGRRGAAGEWHDRPAAVALLGNLPVRGLRALLRHDSCRLRARPELSPGAACHDCPWCQAPRSASGPRRRGRGSVG